MVEKIIKIKKRGGGTRLQRVKVLASGKFRFIKNKASTLRNKRRKSRRNRNIALRSGSRQFLERKGLIRRRNKRKSQPIRRTKTTKRTVARRSRIRRASTRARGIASKITGNKFVRGAVLGLGGGALAIQVSDRFAPQFSGIAGPVGAFVMGGPIGLVASLFLQGGLGGIFGGGQTAGNGGGQTV